jgi:iduronate 2-sulfatase
MPEKSFRQFLTRRQFCGGVVTLGAAAISSCREKPYVPPPPAKGPNVLLIVADDLNNSLGCMGNSVVQSPNIDRIAQRGVKFERAYCQYPVCNPSRTSMLTGLRPEKTGVMTNGTHVVPDAKDAPLLPRFLRDKGYFTLRVGKIYHDSKRMLDGKPLRTTDDPAGWDISEDEPLSNEDSDETAAIKEAQQGGEPRRIAKLEVEDDATGDGMVARRVVKLMEEKLAKDRPFFMAAGFRKPHLPWVAPRKYFDLYPLEKLVPPTYPADHIKSLLPIAVNKTVGQEVPAQQAKEFIAAYYACVSFVDAQVGLMLDALQRLKLAENTLVILLGDHGFHLGDHGMWGKSTLFEQSAKTPLIMAGPGISAGGACGRTVELLDIYPTIVDLCGLPNPGPLQGASLRPLLIKPDSAWDRPAYTALRHDRILGRSVRTERYRYTEWDGGNEGVELYDYQADPNEWRNLAKDPGAAAIISNLKGLLK